MIRLLKFLSYFLVSNGNYKSLILSVHLAAVKAGKFCHLG